MGASSEQSSATPHVSDREAKFLNRLSRKYEHSDSAGLLRSYLIASVVIVAMFALARWIPWWPVALIVVQAIGLALFRQYKRFAGFKSGLLCKLWIRAQADSTDTEAGA